MELATTRTSIWYRSACALTIASGLYFIWANRFLPLQDYPDWLYQGYLFSKFLIGHPLPEYTLKTYPIPDATATFLIGILNLVVSPEASGKVALSLSLCSFVASSIYLFKSFNPSEENLLLYLPLVLAINDWFFFGNIAYYFALSILFLFFGYVIRRLDDLRTANVPIIFTLLTALFFTHLIPYFEACVFSAILFLRTEEPGDLSTADYSHRVLRTFSDMVLDRAASLRRTIGQCLGLVARSTYNCRRSYLSILFVLEFFALPKPRRHGCADGGNFQSSLAFGDCRHCLRGCMACPP